MKLRQRKEIVNYRHLTARPKLLVMSVLVLALAGCSRNNGGGITAKSGGWPPSSSSSPTEVSSSLDVVAIRTEAIAVSADRQSDAKVFLNITPGFHINANPATFPYLIATKMEVGNSDGMITAGKPGYPSAQKKKFQFADEHLAVYEGEVELSVPLSVTSKTARGQVSLPIMVTVQACDEEKCYPPGVLNSMIPVEVK